MSLDLADVISGWECPAGELSARVVVGPDGHELVQLRVDLGVLQMYPDGRPDGALYHGLPTVVEYLQHELRVGRDAISGEHWQALDRELTQLNHRRLAFATVVEEALHRQAEDEARQYLLRVLRDVDLCQGALRLLSEQRGSAGDHEQLWPTLVFNRARLLCQLRVLDEDYDGAIEAAEDGAVALADLLRERGAEDDELAEDLGVLYLQELAAQLRQQYQIESTLREQLAEAIAHDDFEAAADLHRKLDERAARRRATERFGPAPPNLN